MASAVSRNKAAAAATAARQRISSAVSSLKQRISGSGCSFAGSTGVLMADGTVKTIDQVEPGDEVLATDPETGEKEAKRVEATHGHDNVVLTLVLTSSTGEKRGIGTAEDHPFWSETEREFQRADELEPGELVLTADGGTTMEGHAVLTEEVTFEQAWNLTVQGPHTYSVIATGADVGAGSTRGPPDPAAADAVLVYNCPIFGPLDSLGRRTGVQANLMKNPVGCPTNPPRSWSPPGYNVVLHQKGHLLGAQLGGSNSLRTDFVSQFRRGNNRWQKAIETEVRGVVEAGEDVFYSVTPLYHGNSLVPHAMTFHARGSGGYALDLTLLNRSGFPTLRSLDPRPVESGGLMFGSRG
jgi:hypothetical protein